MEKTVLYHVAFEVIRDPDIKIGRKNADFGQGFYLSTDKEFLKRWARVKKGSPTYLNEYELTSDGLNVKYFSRNREWFNYIFANRSLRGDMLGEYDVIVGPIANDTIYDAWGITSSGFLKKDDAILILSGGPEYRQVAIKTEKARSHLKYNGSVEISGVEIEKYREIARKEEEKFQSDLAETLAKIANIDIDELDDNLQPKVKKD
ncbi:MAG: DUF3990 domain-containing protein [Clostridia bacterium]|nr:DUF3990 domain-containing protein [Clostridia bacterium]